MKSVRVDASKAYEVVIGAGILSELGERVKAVHAPCQAALVSDETVSALYAQKAAQALENAGFRVVQFSFPAGEASKTLETYAALQQFLIRNALTRTDIIVALGGGVTGDLAGFAAATYQRGIPFVQAPTTLLCAVDASVGGKTAVDLPEGKNLVGAFHQPSLVLCDTDTLRTLPKARLSDGAAESIKHGLILDQALFGRMADGSWQGNLEEIIAGNVEIKRSFVVGDEQDKGKRQLLNFGHTMGHAIESLSEFSLSHGEAVGIGLLLETRAAHRMGFGADAAGAVEKALLACALPTKCPFSAAQVLKTALRDKKRAGDTILVGALKQVGEGYLKTLSLQDFERFVRLGLEEA